MSVKSTLIINSVRLRTLCTLCPTMSPALETYQGSNQNGVGWRKNGHLLALLGTWSTELSVRKTCQHTIEGSLDTSPALEAPIAFGLNKPAKGTPAQTAPHTLGFLQAVLLQSWPEEPRGSLRPQLSCKTLSWENWVWIPVLPLISYVILDKSFSIFQDQVSFFINGNNYHTNSKQLSWELNYIKHTEQYNYVPFLVLYWNLSQEAWN